MGIFDSAKGMARLAGRVGDAAGAAMPWFQVATAPTQAAQENAIAAARLADDEKRQRQKKEAEEAARKEAVRAAVLSDASLAPYEGAMLASPEIFGSVIGAKIKSQFDAKAPGDRYKAAGDKIFDTTSGQFVMPEGQDGAPIMDEDQFKLAQGLRKEAMGSDGYGSYSKALPAFEGMIEAAGREDKMADLHMVYSLAKIMDPDSVVREGEQIMVQRSQGLSPWLLGQINAINGGNQLDQGTRIKMLTEAESRMKAYRSGAEREFDLYGRNADVARIDRELVLPTLQDLPKIKLSNGDELVANEDGSYTYTGGE